MRTHRPNRRMHKCVYLYPPVLMFVLLSALSSLSAEDAAQKRPLPDQQMAAFMCFTVLMLAPVVFTIAGIGLHLYVRAMFPRWTANIAFALRESRWKSLFLGLANIPFLVLISGMFAESIPPLALIPLLALLLFLLLGLIGKAENLGSKISSAVGLPSNPIASIFAAWPVLSILIIVPIAGWAVFIYMLISGTGGVILSLFRFRRDIPTTESVLANDK